MLFLAALVMPLAIFASDDDDAAEHGWHLAMQSWTLHNETLVDAMTHTAQLGVKYIEVYPGQVIGGQWGDKRFDFNLSDADCKSLLKYAKKKGVKIVSTGVFTTDNPDDWAKEFAFAKRMKLKQIVCEPRMQDWDMIEKLARKTGIKVAVHNHPKPSAYWNPIVLSQVISKRSRLLGSCADIGHWLRCGLMPLECLRVLDGRIISFHFKDVVAGDTPDAMHDTTWGQGVIGVKAIMQALKKQHFKGYFMIEYENESDKSPEVLRKCIKYFNEVADDIF